MAHAHIVEIFIDDKKYDSPTPTTGHALYVLANVQAGYAIFRETKGKKDDDPVLNDDKEIHLHEKEEFYTAQSDLNPGR